MSKIPLHQVPRKITKAELIQLSFDALMVGDVKGAATDEVKHGLIIVLTNVADEIFKAKLNPKKVLSVWALGVMARATESIAQGEEAQADG